MKQIIFVCCVLSIFFLGCKRTSIRFQKKFQSKERNYIIEQYSGGMKIKEYRFKGLLNEARKSGGYYWFASDTLYEVSGDLSIRSWE